MPTRRLGLTLPWILIISALLLTACGRTTDDPMQQQPHVIRGMALLEPPVPLSTGSSFLAELVDLSAGDTDATVVARQSLSPAGQSPLPVELRYDPTALAPGAQLAVRASVSDKGEEYYRSASLLPVDRRLASEIVELRLEAQPAAHAEIERRARESTSDPSLPPPPEFESEVPEVPEVPPGPGDPPSAD